MKKYIPYLLFCLCVFSIAFIKNERINIDYQYQRNGGTYNAYTVYLVNDGKKSSYEFELVSNTALEKISSIMIRQQEKVYKINYELVSRPFLSDDKNLKSITVKLNLDKVLANATKCDGFIVFNLNNGDKIELPILPCKIKEASKS